MINIQKYLTIANLLAKKLLSQQSERDEEKINDWLKDGNDEIYKSIMALDDYQSIKSDIQKVNVKEGWGRVRKQIPTRQNPIKRMLPTIIHYAASIIVALGITGGLFYLGYVGLIKQPETQISQDIIPPGVRKAELILNDGSRITLDKNYTNPIVEKDGSTIVNTSEALDYKKLNKNFGKKDLYNSLEVKHGWEYQLTLSDGTNVWINSMSVLKYPVHFLGNERVVELDGEAYFEVTHNPAKPFIVKTPGYDVEVLGTSFNISYYEEDSFSHVTLAEGKVKVSSSVKDGDKPVEYRLNPGQQFYFDKRNDQRNIKEVEPTDYSGWKGGYFVFEEENLENIFRKYARWYNMNYSFSSDELKEVIFSGKLPRFENFQTIANMMSKISDIKITINGNNVVIDKL